MLPRLLYVVRGIELVQGYTIPNHVPCTNNVSWRLDIAYWITAIHNFFQNVRFFFTCNPAIQVLWSMASQWTIFCVTVKFLTALLLMNLITKHSTNPIRFFLTMSASKIKVLYTIHKLLMWNHALFPGSQHYTYSKLYEYSVSSCYSSLPPVVSI